MTKLLEVNSLTKQFGGLAAVDDLSFQLESGVILGVIGPNGSGKTTLLNVINGVYKPDRGSIKYHGVITNGMKPYELAAKGVARTFQNARVFLTISTYQNMIIPLLHRNISPRALENKAKELLESVDLLSYADVPASELSGGQKKLLEFARALMTDPRLILMDEPFAGVHPTIKSTLCDRIIDHQKMGTSMILVSHEVPVIMGLSEEVLCMASGKIVAHDTPSEISKNDEVIAAYLGHGGEVS